MNVGNALAGDGCLFLGPTESLWQLCPELESVDMGDCFCYRHRTPQAADRQSGRPQSRSGAATATSRSKAERTEGGVPARGHAPGAESLETGSRDRPPSERVPKAGDGSHPLHGLDSVIEALSKNRVEAAGVAVDSAVQRDREDAVHGGIDGDSRLPNGLI